MQYDRNGMNERNWIVEKDTTNMALIQRTVQNLPTQVRGKLVNNALKLMREASFPYRKLMAYYTCAMMEVETKLNVLNEEFSLQYDRNPISAIKTRLKSFDSIIEKLQRKELPMDDFDVIEQNLNDIAGVRVICSFPEDVYMLAEALLKQDDIRLLERKDYIASPKANGYRSLHLIVEVPIFLAQEKRLMKVEVQLRTIAMDFWASLEHQLKYKKELENTEELTRELLECAEVSAALDAKMEEIRKRIMDAPVKK